MSDTRLFIDGRWRAAQGGRKLEVLNPATEERLGWVAHAGPVDVSEVLRAAEAALPAWRTTTAERRAAILLGAAQLLQERSERAAITLTTEQGKPLAESRVEIARAIDTLAWHASAAASTCAPRRAGDKSALILPEPVGIVAAFTPWNYPAVIIARKLGAALAGGCTVVLKAAEETPGIAAQIVETLSDAGLPPGVVNLVFGDPPAISAQLLDAEGIRVLSFTGSTAVGKQLAERAARSLKRCVLELGGHAPVLVFADAELDTAVRAILAYKFECAGQSCNAPSRIYVEAPLYERFTDAFVDAARQLHIGNGLDPDADIGPMATARRLAAMTRLAEDALARGARVVTGGERERRPGFFWPPTILTDVPDSAVLMSEEPFGPIVPISPFRTFAEAITRANATPYGLAAYVFTQSAEIATAAVQCLAVGSVGVNELQGVPPNVGIAGIKDSGYGYEGGARGIEELLNLKAVRGRPVTAAPGPARA